MVTMAAKVAKTLVSAAELRNEKIAFGVVRVTIYMKRKMAVLYMGFRVGLAHRLGPVKNPEGNIL